MPIRLRLTLWYLGTLLILLLLFAAIFIGQAYFTLLRQTDHTLTLAAGQAIDEVQIAPEPRFIDAASLQQSMIELDKDLNVFLVTADGSTIQRLSRKMRQAGERPGLVNEEFAHSVDVQVFIEPDSEEGNQDDVATGISTSSDIVQGDRTVADNGTTEGYSIVTMEHESDFESLAEVRRLPTVVPHQVFETVHMDGVRWRFYSQEVASENAGVVWLQVAQSLEVVDEFIRNVTRQMLFAVPLVFLLAGLGGHVLSRRALAPIEEMTTTAQTIGIEDLHRRIEYRGPADEVGRLALTINSMFDRLQSAFERERRFTGDAAHELRTPLTALKGKIEVTLSRERLPHEYSQAISTMSEQVDRLIRISNDLLFITRLEQTDKNATSKTCIRVDELLHTVVSQMQPLAQQKQIAISEELASGLATRGEPDLLIRLFLNLLDNAIKFTPEHGSVWVTAQPVADGIHIRIRDTGVGIPAEHLPHLFTRFYRVQQDRARLVDDAMRSLREQVGGSGLGLAIAREIVHAHDGAISATSEVDQGTTVTVFLPSLRS